MSNGVKEYTKTKVSIYFPNHEVACRYCPLLETYSRNQCRCTGEYLLDTKGVGVWCPLEREEEENEK